MAETLTVRDVAALEKVHPEVVLGWIHCGDLKAWNAATKNSGRPLWRIAKAELAAFKRRREARPNPPPASKRRLSRDQPGMEVIEFF